MLDETGSILRAQVAVPGEWLEPGPRGQRFHVVDYDSGAQTLLPPADLTDPDCPEPLRPWSHLDRFADADDSTLARDAAFHAQNVYAIAARTLALFEKALGRRLPWAFEGHQLFLVPHAFTEANAHYSTEDCALLFGYLPLADGSALYTSLSHDIVVHETTHAILDGLRPRFSEPALPDQPAFHEALGDIAAMLSVFSLPEVVTNALGKADARGRIPAARVTREALQESVLFKLAEQFGEATTGVRGSALRRSLSLSPGGAWRNDLEFEEPHRRGEVVVAATLEALLEMWLERIPALVENNTLDRDRAAEEGAKAAAHLLQMVIRALDYAPSAELEFEDFLDALLVADAVVAPDDEHAYRPKVERAFARFDVRKPQEGIEDLAGERLLYDNVNVAALRSSTDEVFRFIWQNADRLGVNRQYHLSVDAVHPSVRLGPDGLLVHEVVADYVQRVQVPVAQLAPLGVTVPAGLDRQMVAELWGGGTLVFDQFGMAKYHQRKPLTDWERQTARLAYLARQGLFNPGRRQIGFSLGQRRGLRFAAYHVSDVRAGEAW